MFYSTQLKSIEGGYAVDVRGKKLTFIGYLPVKAGDIVYTDGNVIFGNAPPRGNVFIPDTPSGIPVIGAFYLRGYFTPNGRFKPYKIAGEDWIVNSEKTYAHDDGGENIVDAEIAKDGSVFTVEQQGNEYQMRDGEVTQTCEVIIRKNEVEHERINLADLLKKYEVDTKNDIAIDIPNHEFEDNITSSATLLNFKILPDEKWEALIKCIITAKRTFHQKTFSIACNVNREVTYTYTPINSYEDLGEWGDLYQVPESIFSQVIKPTRLDILEHNYTLTESPHEEILEGSEKTTDETVTLLIKVTSGTCEVIGKSKYSTPLIMTDIIEKIVPTSVLPAEKRTKTPDTLDSWVDLSTSEVNVYPTSLLDSFKPSVPEWANLSDNGRVIAYYTGTAKRIQIRGLVAEYLDQTEGTAHAEFGIARWECTYDSRNLPNYQQSVIEVESSFTFPVQDNYQAEIISRGGNIDRWQLNGVFDEDDNQIVGNLLPSRTDAHTWNMSLVPLKGNEVLFGIHDGAFLKIDKDGTARQVGYRLKNFRLRELKKIRKAKK